MTFAKYSMGMGDRFGLQGEAQLRAIMAARTEGVDVCPVWNKSHREHTIIHTRPEDVRVEADAAVAALGWDADYRVDADHISLETVGDFLAPSDFFTIDVANAIGTRASDDAVAHFAAHYAGWCGEHPIDGIPEPVIVTPQLLVQVADQYLHAVQQAGMIYRHIESALGKGTFVTEVSMDETSTPQSPPELLFILAALADEGVPVQTIAPRFSGRFNKGVDYVGEVSQFAAEFEADLAVIRYAVGRLDLPAELKLSVHSGSDKFSIYPCIRDAVRRFDAGLHVKTAGTTWLEELIGLAESGPDGLAIAREIYRSAHGRFDELCGPYADVIDISPDALPTPDTVDTWDGMQYARTLRHDQSCADYNPHFRQLLHVGYKVAAEMGDRYLDALRQNATAVSRNVTENLLERHIRPLFLA